MNIKGNSKVKKAEICQKVKHSHPWNINRSKCDGINKLIKYPKFGFVMKL